METSGTTGRIMEIQDQKIELQGATLLHMNEIRKWTHFLSILGFVTIGLLMIVIVILFASSVISSFSLNPYGGSAPWFGVLYSIFAVIYFFPVYYLFRFSVLAKQSLLQINLGGGGSNELMSNAIEFLKKHFRFVGILMIVVLCINLLVVTGMVIWALILTGLK